MTQTTVLIDAQCVMCNGLARFLQQRARSDASLAILGIESDEGQAMIADFPERLKAMDTVYVVRNGRVYGRSAGAIRLLLCMKWYLRHVVPVRLVGAPPPSGRCLLVCLENTPPFRSPSRTKGPGRAPPERGPKRRCHPAERWCNPPAAAAGLLRRK